MVNHAWTSDRDRNKSQSTTTRNPRHEEVLKGALKIRMLLFFSFHSFEILALCRRCLPNRGQAILTDQRKMYKLYTAYSYKNNECDYDWSRGANVLDSILDFYFLPCFWLAERSTISSFISSRLSIVEDTFPLHLLFRYETQFPYLTSHAQGRYVFPSYFFFFFSKAGRVNDKKKMSVWGLSPTTPGVCRSASSLRRWWR